jgi:hypothetical protein
MHQGNAQLLGHFLAQLIKLLVGWNAAREGRV